MDRFRWKTTGGCRRKMPRLRPSASALGCSKSAGVALSRVGAGFLSPAKVESRQSPAGSQTSAGNRSSSISSRPGQLGSGPLATGLLRRAPNHPVLHGQVRTPAWNRTVLIIDRGEVGRGKVGSPRSTTLVTCLGGEPSRNPDPTSRSWFLIIYHRSHGTRQG